MEKNKQIFSIHEKLNINLKKHRFMPIAISINALSGVMICHMFFGRPCIGLLCTLASKYTCNYMHNYFIDKRKRQMNKIVRDFLFNISAYLEIGHCLGDCAILTLDKMNSIYGNDNEFCRALASFKNNMQISGIGEEEAFAILVDQIEHEDLKGFYQIFSICRKSGGNLIEACNNAARIIGEKLTMEQDISAILAQRKMEGRIMSIMPFALVGLISFTAPEYLEPMYTSIGGIVVMALALTMTLMGIYMMERIVRIEV